MSSSPTKTELLGKLFLFVPSSSRRVARRLKVDLHVNFMPVNETEAKYEVSQVNVIKLSEVQLLCLHAHFHTLPLMYLRA